MGGQKWDAMNAPVVAIGLNHDGRGSKAICVVTREGVAGDLIKLHPAAGTARDIAIKPGPGPSTPGAKSVATHCHRDVFSLWAFPIRQPMSTSGTSGILL